MKTRLKEAVTLHQEMLADMKAAAAVPESGELERTPAFQIAATFAHDAAQALREVDHAPTVIVGEAVPSQTELPDADGGWAVRDTLASPDTPALAASLARTELLAQSHLDVLALSVDAAASANCNDSMTKMLAHQAGLAHAAAFKLMNQALAQGDQIEVARLVNAAARMMNSFQQALLVLHRLRHSGQQTMTVQHINVSADQAVVTGSVQAGGGLTRRGNRNEK